MKINYKKIFPLLLLSPSVVLAQMGVTSENVPESVNLTNIITDVINWAFGLLILLAAVFIIIAAFMYLSSAGNEDKIKNAKNYIIYAAVAILIGFLAKAIVTLVTRLLGV
ncbi:MAG: hypothetical protein WC297_02465 [Candidatus Paceibacterota bacterium]|jgi:hypothetical protein